MFNRKFSKAIPAVTFIVPIVAAFFAWEQGDIARDHNRRSVKPILQLVPYAEGKGGRNGLYLSNDGLGPAIIKGFSVRTADVEAKGFGSDRWAELLAMEGISAECFASGWPRGETAIRAGVESPLLRLTTAELRKNCTAELIKLIHTATIEVTINYESVYLEPDVLKARSRIDSQTLARLSKSLTPPSSGTFSQ